MLLRTALSLCLLAASCSPDAPPPNVLVIVVDTLRADRLSASGYERSTTPNLDRLADDGLRFTHAQSPRAKTTPAMATLFSGRYPHEHGLRDLTMPLGDDVPLLAEHLREHGYQTLGIIGNFVMQARLSGLARGFEHWVEDLPNTAGVPERSARSLTDGALAALGLGAPSSDGAGPERALLQDTQPWFLYLHYMDPHGVYDPPREHDVFESLRPDPIPHPLVPTPGSTTTPWVAEYNVLAEDRLADGRIDAAAVRDRYDGEVRYVDHELGRLFDALRKGNLLDDTLVIVVADHGESLGEHDYWFEHGRYAYEATCRVPLILRFPTSITPTERGGVRRADFALADLAPTLCAWLGIEPLAGQTGRARPELATRDDAAPSPVFSEKVERADLLGAVQAKAVRIGDWKLLRRMSFVADDAAQDGRRLVVLGEELYDLADDPAEARNLASSPPAEAPIARLAAELDAFTAADHELSTLAEQLERAREDLQRLDPDTLRRLEALGY